jgi:predicted ArsR family transcriptional regulator
MDRAAVAAVAALDDDVRRALYEHIRAAAAPVTREDAAAAVGISRKLAAFHLDKLVEAGLLRACSRPGPHRVGRAPKAYEPSGADVRVSIPPRRPDLLADILLDAVLTDAGPEPPADSAVRAARERGRGIGAAERAAARPGRLGAERAATLAAGALARHGFEPVRPAPDRLHLRTCPFHPLVARAPQLVCAINHAFLAGLLEGLDAPSVTARLAAGTGGCCVEVAPGTPAGPAAGPSGGQASRPVCGPEGRR